MTEKRVLLWIVGAVALACGVAVDHHSQTWGVVFGVLASFTITANARTAAKFGTTTKWRRAAAPTAAPPL